MRSYFGLAALFTGVVSIILLGGYFGITILNISPATFFQVNNVLTLSYCIMTPVTAFLAVLGLMGRNDSKSFSIISLALIGLPFLVLLWQFISSFQN